MLRRVNAVVAAARANRRAWLHVLKLVHSRRNTFAADTLVFAPDGTGRGLLTAISRDLNTNIETPTRLVRTFQHTRDGERVLLDSLDCGPGCAISPRQTRYALRDNWLEQTGLSGDWARCERVSP